MAISDVRDVMPECVIKVISTTLHFFIFNRMFVKDSQTLRESHTRILNHPLTVYSVILFLGCNFYPRAQASRVT